MKTNLLNLLLLLTTTFLYSQTYNIEDYSVSRQDVELNSYPADSTANALVIYEYGKSFIAQSDFLLKTEYKKKVKILNRNGFDKATVEIPLYSRNGNKETISEIEATTFNLVNGSVKSTRLNPANIYYEQSTENITNVKFTLPNVQEGSVITYSYKLSSPYKFKFHGWNFQEDIPKLYSEYDTSIPGNYLYNIKLVGFLKFFSNDYKLERNCLSGGNGAYADCSVSKYVMKDIPAFIEEDYMTSSSNYLSRIDYELQTFNGFDGRVDQITKTWKSVDKELKSDVNIGGQLKKTVNADKILPQDIYNEPDQLKKAQAIYDFVQEHYKWNENYKIFRDVSVKDVIKTQTGNISGINILLHNLLEESNISVKPVLLSTRANGFATKIFPILSDFNYLIVQATINDKTYLLDATDKYLTFGMLPFKCLNGYGRLLDFKNGSSWIDINVDTPSIIAHKAEIDIKDGLLKGNVHTKKTGYYALNSKSDYLSSPESYKKSVENKKAHMTILNHKIETSDKNDEEFIEQFEIEMEGEQVAETIYLYPYIFPFFTENPFKLQERTYPIDFGYSTIFVYNCKIKHDGFKVKELPGRVNLTIPNNKGTLLVETTENEDHVLLNLKLNLKEPIYSPEYYPSLKQLLSEFVKCQSNSVIVLDKV